MPALKESAGDPVARGQSRDARAHSLHNADAIGERYPGYLDRPAKVLSPGNRLVAEIERIRADSYQDVALNRHRNRELDQRHLVDRSTASRHLPGAHVPAGAHRACPVQVRSPGAVRSSPARAFATAGRAVTLSRHATSRGQRLPMSSSGNIRSTIIPHIE